MNIITRLSLLAVIVLFGSLTGCHKQQVNSNTTFAGYIENTQVNVNTRIPGRIVKLLVDEGQKVEQGDTIAVLDKTELLENKKALLSRLENIRTNRKRIENLYKAGAIPQQKLDEIETNYQFVYHKILALDSKLNDMTITAPISGIVVTKILEKGQMMPPGMPVVVLTDTNSTYARFSIPENYLDQINMGQSFTLKSAVKNLTIKAKVFQIIPMANFATKTPTTLRGQRDVRSFSVKMKFDKFYPQLKPGMSVYLSLKNPEIQGE